MEGGRQETRVAELADGSMRAYYPVYDFHNKISNNTKI